MKNKFTIAIHGGVGTILKQNMTQEKENAYLNTLKEAIEAGEQILNNEGTSINAVEAAVMVMENSPLFNAGKGSVFTHDEKIEMDASIMDGKTCNAGSVAGVGRIKNPINAAHKVMTESDHINLIGLGAETFAEKYGCQMEDQAYFKTEDRYQQLLMAKESGEVLLDHSGANKKASSSIENGGRKLGTVGAVALDIYGNIAAATSTGGMTNKKFGRIGDTPIIGAGTYAKNTTCAISCTGHGEYFIKNVVAYDISALMEYKGLSLQEACDYVILGKLKDQEGEGGLVGVDRQGNVVMCFNTEGMYRGYANESGIQELKIYGE